MGGFGLEPPGPTLGHFRLHLATSTLCGFKWATCATIGSAVRAYGLASLLPRMAILGSALRRMDGDQMGWVRASAAQQRWSATFHFSLRSFCGIRAALEGN